MNIYEIDARLREAWERAVDQETGEVLDEEALTEIDALEMARDEKIENTGCWLKNLRSDAAALKAEEDALRARRKTVENRMAGLERYLRGALGGERFVTPRLSVTFRRTDRVEVEDASKIPPELMRTPDPEPDKAEIRRLLKSGKAVPGCALAPSLGMTVK